MKPTSFVDAVLVNVVVGGLKRRLLMDEVYAAFVPLLLRLGCDAA
jgi:hypothetical protein